MVMEPRRHCWVHTQLGNPIGHPARTGQPPSQHISQHQPVGHQYHAPPEIEDSELRCTAS